MKLGVNIDHVATLRQVRRAAYPDIVAAAQEAEAGGAAFITIHLREDRRHIVDEDVPRLAAAVNTHINLEIAATAEMHAFALQHRPVSLCLVPEKREELTTEGGLDVVTQQARVREFAAGLVQAGIEVSLFIDPDERQVEAAAACGVQAVELHTGTYAHTGEVAPLQRAAACAAAAGLKTNAGHGLTLHNVGAVCRLPLAELNIGHSIVARAVFVGLRAAVAEMAAAIEQAQQDTAQ